TKATAALLPLPPAVKRMSGTSRFSPLRGRWGVLTVTSSMREPRMAMVEIGGLEDWRLEIGDWRLIVGLLVGWFVSWLGGLWSLVIVCGAPSIVCCGLAAV